MPNTASTTMTIRMDRQVKDDAQKIFHKLGMDMTTAINIFLRKAISFRGMPFEVCLEEPNEETLAAMAEANEIAKHPECYKSYANAEEFHRAMVAENDEC